MSEIEVQAGLFLEDLTLRGFSGHTVRAYSADLKSFFPFAPGPVAALKVSHVREWMTSLYDRHLGIPTVRRNVAALRTFFGFMKGRGLMASNPARVVHIPRALRRSVQVPTVKQLDSLIDGIESAGMRQPVRDLAIFELLYGCGLRVSELVGLNVADIDRAEAWLLIRGKGKRERSVPYGRMAKAALEGYLEYRSAYVTPGYRNPRTLQKAVHRGARPGNPLPEALFVNKSRKRLSARYIQTIVTGYGLRLTGDPALAPHVLRHAYATHLLLSGAGIRELQVLLGHSSPTGLQVYTHVSTDDLIRIYDNAHPRSAM